MTPSHIIVAGDAIDHLLGEYYWVIWPDGVTEIAGNMAGIATRRVWRNMRGATVASVDRVLGRVSRPNEEDGA